jgi:hypothetical protein
MLSGDRHRIYEVRWADGRFEGDDEPLNAITALIFMRAEVSVIPLAPPIRAGEEPVEAAYVTARNAFDRIVSESGEIPEVDNGVDPDDPDDTIY